MQLVPAVHFVSVGLAIVKPDDHLDLLLLGLLLGAVALLGQIFFQIGQLLRLLTRHIAPPRLARHDGLNLSPPQRPLGHLAQRVQFVSPGLFVHLKCSERRAFLYIDPVEPGTHSRIRFARLAPLLTSLAAHDVPRHVVPF